MNIDTAKKIIENEGLKCVNWFLDHKVKPNEVIIYKKEEKWVVCAADERACIVDTSYSYYENEEIAIDDFIERARLEKIL